MITENYEKKEVQGIDVLLYGAYYVLFILYYRMIIY